MTVSAPWISAGSSASAGSFTITVTANTTGTERSGIVMIGGRSVTVTQPPNQAPSAVDDTVSTTRGIAVTVSVLTNDSDRDPGDTIRVSAIAALPANGSVAVGSDTTTIVYTPSNHHIGNDMFRYRIADRAGLTAEATVNVTVDLPPAPFLPSTCADPIDTLVADAGEDQTVSPGTLVTLDGSGSGDGLGCSIRYSWTRIEGSDVALSSQTAQGPTFAVPEDAEDGTAWVFELTVRHRSNSRFSAVDQVRVTVDVDRLTLNDLRDSLVEGWADRIGKVGDGQVCEAWHLLDHSARNVFIWNTHRLHRSRLLRDVTALHAVFGTDSHGFCGGEEYNRTFMSMGDSLQDKFLAEALKSGSDPLPAWRHTQDPKGPHLPYMFSIETHDGNPRGQIHFFTGTGYE